jgi:TetR/AcrR family transcriptional repressor of nem operon
MGRPREFDNDEVLTALQDVFWEYGYEGASYADIMKATGLKKGSLYASFGDKRSLYLQALDKYDKSNVSGGVAMLRNEGLTGHERISALMQSLVDAAETKRGRWGCLLCNAAVDQAPFDSSTEKVVQASMQRMRDAIAVALKETRAADKAALIWTAYFGGRVIIKSGGRKTVLRDIKEQTLSLL